MPSESRVHNPLFHPFLFLYQLWQWALDLILAPSPPEPHARLGRPKIAVIGAGITGVTSASHCIGHGFDVVIFEAGGEGNLGGIWSVSLTRPETVRVASVWEIGSYADGVRLPEGK